MNTNPRHSEVFRQYHQGDMLAAARTATGSRRQGCTWMYWLEKSA
ncbi:hypothetical protein [Schlesneria paludicola]|nr:hypothetical protein [Schlesneria paludicola]